jgi:hypothetical protein
MASELSTTWTRIAHEATRHSTSLWLGAGVVLVLGGTLVTVLWLRSPSSRLGPPPVPKMPVPAAYITSKAAEPVAEEQARESPSRDLTVDAPSAPPSTSAASGHDNVRARAPGGRQLAEPRVISGTPLIPEPGF